MCASAEDRQPDVYFSLVAPAYNEQQCIEDFCRECFGVLEGLARPFELIVVDDCSTDQTRNLLLKLRQRYRRLRVIGLDRNCGKTGAMDAGLKFARGEIVGIIDADMQNDPADLPRMLELIEAGECDMVVGWRKHRRDNWLRLVSTRVANWVRNKLTGETIHDSATGLQVFRRRCIERVKLFDGLHRFLPTLVKLEGYRVQEVVVNHRPRTTGRAKYGLWNRVFRALRDLFAVRWMKRRFIRYHAREL